MGNLHDKRKIYSKNELLETHIDPNPMQMFRKWMLDAENDDSVLESNAMCISTLDEDLCPRQRMVLLKSYNENGFVFYTNYNSNKGKSLDNNPKMSLHFFWQSMERQIIIKAKAKKIAENLSDGYFSSRPKGSQLGAIVSPQSDTIPSREFLEKKLKNLEKEFETTEPQRPKHWGGYIAMPYEIEFWQGRPNRLHDRICYKLNHWDWIITRKAP